MKIKALVNAFPSLQKIAGQDLRAKTLYHVSLLLNRFDKEIEAYENTRINLLEKYGEKDGDMYKIKPECKEIFENEMQELYDTDVNTDGLKPVEIPADEDIRISYTDLTALEGFIKIKLEEKDKNAE